MQVKLYLDVPDATSGASQHFTIFAALPDASSEHHRSSVLRRDTRAVNNVCPVSPRDGRISICAYFRLQLLSEYTTIPLNCASCALPILCKRLRQAVANIGGSPPMRDTKNKL